LSSDDVVGSHRRFARRFAEGIGKLVGKAKGDRWKKTGGLVARLPEYAGRRLDRPYHKIRATGKSPRWRVNRPYHNLGGGQLLTAGKPPRSVGFDLHPKKIGSRCRCASRRTRKWTYAVGAEPL
ncbi:hypothetical protein BHE74_00003346, partial [Ensete ventricosum]